MKTQRNDFEEACLTRLKEVLPDAEITASRRQVGAYVCVKARGMKEAWRLAASDGALSASQIVNLYAKRWTIEPSVRDEPKTCALAGD